jgi:hypothetical protein
MGIDLKLITADEAYHDKDGSLFAETGVIFPDLLLGEAITRPSGQVRT